MEYSERSTIRSFTIVSSKYCEIAQPLLFRRILIKSRKRLPPFAKELENSSKIASMIKVLIICAEIPPKLLRRLFAVVSCLEWLVVEPIIIDSVLLPHCFPNLRRLHIWPATLGDFNNMVANFIPCHRVLDDLKVTNTPKDFTVPPLKESAYMPPFTESVSIGVDRLVTYRGPSSLLPLLTPNSKMKHLISSQQLDEGTLHKLSSDVSGGLLSLIIDDPGDPLKSETLPGPLVPSLFPTLQSIAWLSLDVQNISVIDQLPHLRRVWFTSRLGWQPFVGVEAFVNKILELSDKKTRPLQEIRVLAQDGHYLTRTYFKISSNSPWVFKPDISVVCIMDCDIE